jgi:AcrR family transcriptional regulator
MRARRAEAPAAPPRESAEQRIRATADRLFGELGVRVVSTLMIADEAGTNEATVMKYFHSKDRLILDYLEPLMRAAKGYWDEALAEPPVAPLDKLRAHFRIVQSMAADRFAGRDELARVSAELPEMYVKSWYVLRAYWQRERSQIAKLCEQAGCREPIKLADQLFLLLEGARVGAECIGPEGPATQLVSAANTLISAHLAKLA